MFPKVKNVNVESPKKRSKLLDFWSGSLPQPLPEGKSFSKAYPNPSLKGRAFLSLPQPLPVGKGFSNFDMRLYMRVLCSFAQCLGRRCVGFACRVCVEFLHSLKHKLYTA